MGKNLCTLLKRIWRKSEKKMWKIECEFIYMDFTVPIFTKLKLLNKFLCLLYHVLSRFYEKKSNK